MTESKQKDVGQGKAEDAQGALHQRGEGASDERGNEGQQGRDKGSDAELAGTSRRKKKGPPKLRPNHLSKIRLERMMSKAELARRANLSVLTIDRIEKGYGCRMDTKRKILDALGLTLADRTKVFGQEE